MLTSKVMVMTCHLINDLKTISYKGEENVLDFPILSHIIVVNIYDQN